MQSITNTLYWLLEEKITAANWGFVEAFLKDHIFGQHIAVNEVYKRIHEHLNAKEFKKALVIICNGSVGTGKTYFGKIIGTHGFRGGFKNPAVKLINGPRDYPDPAKVSVYKEELRTLIETSVAENERCFFLFDEVDKMPVGLLDVLTPYVDVFKDLDEVDYRKSIFMFISNTGGKKIEEIVLQQYKTDPKRENLSLLHFRAELQEIVLNETGGLQGSQIIRKRLIDHYLPFLPLEKSNLVDCLEAQYERIGMPPTNPPINMSELAELFAYGPVENPIFVIDGAKNVDVKLDLELERLKPFQ